MAKYFSKNIYISLYERIYLQNGYQKNQLNILDYIQILQVALLNKIFINDIYVYT